MGAIWHLVVVDVETCELNPRLSAHFFLPRPMP